MGQTRVIIIGGGFGGVKCARILSRELSPAQVEVVLFNQQNHLVFSPLLAEVVGSSINPLDAIVPLRQLLPRVFCRTEGVRHIDFATNEVEYLNESGQCDRMHYDHLVLACGNVTNLNVVPGMADHSFPLKTVADAANLRSHIMDQMEQAEVSADGQRRRWHLTCIVVGGGYSGVEAAGEVNDLMRSSARYFRNWKIDEARVILLHSREQILPEISTGLREFARRKMEQTGVEIVLRARANSATPEGVSLEDGRFFSGGTIICSIGTSTAPLIAGLDLPKQKGRLITQPDLRLPQHPNVWVVGDCGYIINQHDGQPSPTTGQFAERQGKQCARNIVQALTRRPSAPFAFKPLGELCSIGGHSAVADLFGLHLSGFLAWFVWRGVYLFKLPTWGRRLQVGFDWAWTLLFPRDLAHVRTQPTDRVSHAHYDPGDFIFQRGEPATNFYVLERGEVEVVRACEGHGRTETGNGDGHGRSRRPDDEVVAVLGPGSFFGEKALMSNRPRVMSVRARTPVEVLVMGKNLFTRMSGALAPLRDALAQTLNRRSGGAWKDHPQIYALLERTPLRTLLEPPPEPLLKPDMALRDVGRAFVAHGQEFFYVSSDGETIEGVVTITDLLRTQTSASPGDTPLRQFMTPNPVTISLEDSCAVAATAMREYRLKNLPVVETKGSRKLVGCLRVRRLLGYVFEELAPVHAGPV